MTENRRSPVAKAVFELRQILGESQEAFARRLHITVRTAARWETVRPPRAYTALSALANLAATHGRSDLVGRFCPSANEAVEYQAWVVAARPSLERAFSNDSNSGRCDGDSVTLFLDERAAGHEALNLPGLKVRRVVVQFQKETTS